MSSPETEVASMLKALADDVNFEDIQYHIYMSSKKLINRGLERVETEGAVPHEEVKKRLNKWLDC